MPERRTQIHAIIVDDEAPSRRLLAQLLQSDPDIQILAQCVDGNEAIEAISDHKPDLVFLDIQMPECDGFEVIQSVGVDKLPAVVFVTAFDQFAVRAFEVHALDYLLKPFTRERFTKALARAKEHIRKHDMQKPRLRSLLREWQYHQKDTTAQAGRETKHLQRLLIPHAQQIKTVNLSDVVWLEAADHYVTVHTLHGKHLIYESLGSLEETLPPGAFVRIHRGAIINVAHVKKVSPAQFGTCSITMTSGVQLRLSRTRRDLLAALLSHIQ